MQAKKKEPKVPKRSKEKSTYKTKKKKELEIIQQELGLDDVWADRAYMAGFILLLAINILLIVLPFRITEDTVMPDYQSSSSKWDKHRARVAIYSESLHCAIYMKRLMLNDAGIAATSVLGHFCVAFACPYTAHENSSNLHYTIASYVDEESRNKLTFVDKIWDQQKFEVGIFIEKEPPKVLLGMVNNETYPMMQATWNGKARTGRYIPKFEISNALFEAVDMANRSLGSGKYMDPVSAKAAIELIENRTNKSAKDPELYDSKMLLQPGDLLNSSMNYKIDWKTLTRSGKGGGLYTLSLGFKFQLRFAKTRSTSVLAAFYVSLVHKTMMNLKDKKNLLWPKEEKGNAGHLARYYLTRLIAQKMTLKAFRESILWKANGLLQDNEIDSFVYTADSFAKTLSDFISGEKELDIKAMKNVIRRNSDRVTSLLIWEKTFRMNRILISNIGLNDIFDLQGNKKLPYFQEEASLTYGWTASCALILYDHHKESFSGISEPVGAATASGSISTLSGVGDAILGIIMSGLLPFEDLSPSEILNSPRTLYNFKNSNFFIELPVADVKHDERIEDRSKAVHFVEARLSEAGVEVFTINRQQLSSGIPPYIKESSRVLAQITKRKLGRITISSDPREVDENYPTGY
ncbi:unnamed protein product [Caenorhabditis auriculariae]|uniref:Uncharacterized protein n=1 Tax=Caenorhabditis auriculariae TaxID=2777116 RepID=A0A8S1H4K7_9PELO|nr:unnamed protein product [Caenorhabditis auriculariae]